MKRLIDGLLPGGLAAPRVLAAVAAAGLCVGLAGSATPPATPLPAGLDLLLSPSPATRHGERRLLVDVAGTGARLVAVGESGLVLRSQDGGHSWTQSPTPTSVMLTAVSFPTAQAGWAVGHDGVILATRDGGLSWQRQFDGRQGDRLMLEAARAQLAKLPPAQAGTPDAPSDQRLALEDAVAANEAAVADGPSRPLLAVRFADARTGLAAGAFGQLFLTEDGGAHWAYIGDRLDNPEGLHLNAVTLTRDGRVYIAAEAGTVFISPDRGRNWTRAHLGYKGHLYGVLPLQDERNEKDEVLLAYGFNGHLFRSADGGVSWKAVPSPTTKSFVSGALRDGVAVLIDEDGTLASSSDLGENWSRLAERLPVRRVGAMALLPPSHGASFDVLTVGLGGAARHALHGDIPHGIHGRLPDLSQTGQPGQPHPATP